MKESFIVLGFSLTSHRNLGKQSFVYRALTDWGSAKIGETPRGEPLEMLVVMLAFSKNLLTAKSMFLNFRNRSSLKGALNFKTQCLPWGRKTKNTKSKYFETVFFMEMGSFSKEFNCALGLLFRFFHGLWHVGKQMSLELVKTSRKSDWGSLDKLVLLLFEFCFALQWKCGQWCQESRHNVHKVVHKC